MIGDVDGGGRGGEANKSKGTSGGGGGWKEEVKEDGMLYEGSQGKMNLKGGRGKGKCTKEAEKEMKGAGGERRRR